MDVYSHMDAVKKLQRMQSEIIGTSDAVKFCLNPTLINIGKEIDRLMGEVEEGVQKGKVKLKDVLFAAREK